MIYCKHLFEPIYSVNYYFVVCKKQQDFVNIVKRHYNIEIEQHETAEARCAMTQIGNSTMAFVWVRDFKSYSYLGHELIYVLTFLFDKIDTKVTFDNSEPLAYLFRYLYDVFLDKKSWKKYSK